MHEPYNPHFAKKNLDKVIIRPLLFNFFFQKLNGNNLDMFEL